MIYQPNIDFQETDFNRANNDLLEFKENLVHKTLSQTLNKKDIPNEVFFICDHEGVIQYRNTYFSFLETLSKDRRESIDSILDFIHPEDVLFAVENLVTLLQEEAESVVFEARFLCNKNSFYLIKWHVGYFKGLLYFYPINVPLSNMQDPTALAPLENSETLYWKMEIVKTLASWDKAIFNHIKSCTCI